MGVLSFNRSGKRKWRGRKKYMKVTLVFFFFFREVGEGVI